MKKAEYKPDPPKLTPCPPDDWVKVLAPHPKFRLPGTSKKIPCCNLCPADFRPTSDVAPKYLGIDKVIWNYDYANGDGLHDREEEDESEESKTSTTKQSFLETTTSKKGGKGGSASASQSTSVKGCDG